MDNTFKSYMIEDRSYVSYIKREIHREAAQCNFSEMQRGEIDIIVSELASNVIKHVGTGEFLYRVVNTDEGEAVFEIISIDSGHGMTDPSKLMRDGFSTSGTLGHGLGSMNRLSSTFQIYSLPEWGTVFYSKYSSKKNGANKKRSSLELDVQGVCVNKGSEPVCGDGYQIKRTDTTTQIFLGDGLGHGEHAHDAVAKAAEGFLSSSEKEPHRILKEIHEKVRRSRGLVATIAVLDHEARIWRICGIGNILTRLYTGITYKNYISFNGTVGLNIPSSLKDSLYEVEKNQYLIMTSDGIRSRWDLSKYPSILKHEGTVAAATIYKDFTRRNDDASVLIAKII